MVYLLTNVCLLGYSEPQQVAIDAQGKISAITPQSLAEYPQESDKIIDLQGDLLTIGGVDLQINGALGLAFTDLTEADLPRLQEICEFLWQQGVDAFCPTLVTASLPQIR